MENIVRNHRVLWGRDVGAGGSGEEEHVLVLIFSFCVIPPSKRINHKRVISWNDETPAPASSHLLSASCPLQLLSYSSPAVTQENIWKKVILVSSRQIDGKNTESIWLNYWIRERKSQTNGGQSSCLLWFLFCVTVRPLRGSAAVWN